jgi:hypothetical protein
MSPFAETDRGGFGVSLNEKRDALCLDYLRAGKTLDWILENVCGSDRKAIARAVCLAADSRFIDDRAKRQILHHHRIDDKGRHVR